MNVNDKTISKMTRTLISLLILAFVFTVGISAVSAAPGDTIFVNDTGGNDNNDGLTWETAKKTILNATELVNENGIINIANGQYTGTNNVDITIRKNMTINGESQNGTIINGTGNNRIFYIDPGINLTISNLTLTNGTAYSAGGAIYISSGSCIVSISNCNFNYNKVGGFSGGGAIYNVGTLTISNSIFFNNTGYDGGAIRNHGNLTINGSSFINNTGSYGSGAILTSMGSLIISNTVFEGNTALYAAGAIFSSGNLIEVSNSTFTRNSADTAGAIYISQGMMVLNTSNFTDNTATGSGGAIYSSGDITVTDSNFLNNTAKYGGAISNIFSNLTITGSNLINNTATWGGAIYNEVSDLNAHFCRIIGNNIGDIRDNSGFCDIDNNWWGTNFEGTNPVNTGRTNIAVSKWLVLSITANPGTINNGATSLLTADLLHDQNGNYYDPATGHVPDGIPVTFTTDLGSVGSKTITNATSNGVATATLTADETPGIAHINATADSQTVNVDVTINGQTSQSSLYLTVTPNKTNPVVGDTVIYTLKVGNNGPDTASDVVMTYVVPEGLEFAGANVDVGTYTYDPVTRTITWTMGDVPVGDPYMWLSLKVMTAGSYLFNPQLSTRTYDPTLNTDTQSITIHAAAASNSNITNNTANAASTVSMQHTGVPVIALILALFMVIGGMVSSKK